MISKELDEDYFDAKADILQTRINSFLRRSQGGLIDSAVKALIVSTLKETSEDQKELFVGRGWQRLEGVREVRWRKTEKLLQAAKVFISTIMFGNLLRLFAEKLSRNSEMGNKELEEKLAELCHEQWSGWMEYLFEKCADIKLPVPIHCDESVGDYKGIPKWAIDRWQKQMKTSYKDLSEEEKESDRIEARKFIKSFKEFKNGKTKN